MELLEDAFAGAGWMGGGGAVSAWAELAFSAGKVKFEEAERIRAWRRDCLVPFLDQLWPLKRLLDLLVGSGTGVLSSSEDMRWMHSTSEMV